MAQESVVRSIRLSVAAERSVNIKTMGEDGVVAVRSAIHALGVGLAENRQTAMCK
jgi:hypothetical protein